jgi:hypothetical protein
MEIIGGYRTPLEALNLWELQGYEWSRSWVFVLTSVPS